MLDDQLQTSTILDDETRENHANFGDTTSDDEYMGSGACSVFCESDSDFDEANRVGDCDVWEAGSEVVDEPSSSRSPMETCRSVMSCLRRGNGGSHSKRCRVSFHPNRAGKDCRVSAFLSWYSQEGVDWSEPLWIACRESW